MKASLLRSPIWLLLLPKISDALIVGGHSALRQPRPTTSVALPARSALPKLGRTLVPRAEAVSASDDERSAGTLSFLPPKSELKKVLPLGLMFFAILFDYTILRDTKDVLVVTAPKSGAEIIPFLKTYVNLPGAIAFTVAYASMANRLGRQALFYAVLAPFIAFFGAFAWLIYPLRDVLHFPGFAAFLGGALPAGFSAPIAVLCNWTYSLFYLLANMWGSVVVSLMQPR